MVGLFYPSPHLLVLFFRSGTVAVCNLHLPYTDRYVFDILYSQHFLIECIHLFLSSDQEKQGEGNIFYNGRVADWQIKPNAGFNLLVTPPLSILLSVLAGAALTRYPVFSSSILLVKFSSSLTPII